MKSILNLSGDRIELNALFIQPTRWCALECKNCYVKEHSREDFHTPWNEQLRLFEAFYTGQHIANQITISIDDLPKAPEQRDHMVKLTQGILNNIAIGDGRSEDDFRTELHMTVHTPKTLANYVKEGVYGWEGLDMISYSEIILNKDFTEQAHTFHHYGTPINWNKTIPEVGYDFNWKTEIEDFLEKSAICSSVYLIANKSPIGKHRDLLTKMKDHNRMNSNLIYLRELLSRLPRNVISKIRIDGCLSDTDKYLRTGFGCSSNISRFQVWPDGSVSGCPYAFSGNTRRGETAEDILENIRSERGRYDFKEKCHLPQILVNFRKGNTSSNQYNEV